MSFRTKSIGCISMFPEVFKFKIVCKRLASNDPFRFMHFESHNITANQMHATISYTEYVKKLILKNFDDALRKKCNAYIKRGWANTDNIKMLHKPTNDIDLYILMV